MAAASLVGTLRLGTRIEFLGSAARVRNDIAGRGVRRNDARSPPRRRGKNDMIPDEVEPGGRHKGSELLDKLDGLENHVAGSVPPASLEAVQ